MSHSAIVFRWAGCAVLTGLFASCATQDQTEPGAGVAAEADEAGAEGIQVVSNTEEDWRLFQAAARRAYDLGLDTLPIGDAVARIGEIFVGSDYAPHTLEVPGREALVVEMNQFDCVTFVESALGIARFVQSVPEAMLDDEVRRKAMYEGILTRIRYRHGELDGYPSRLHYFSDWIADNDAKGLVRHLSEEIGGVADDEPIDFMTSHTTAYRQLGQDASFVEAMREVEHRLSESPRYYVPVDRIAELSIHIQTGDIIAATSTLEGLDVAHTGIAVWVGDELRLMHAPLAGGTVTISERTLADRIAAIPGQDGIMIARPVPVR